MAAGAEGEPRVQPQLHPVRGAGLLPLRDDKQTLADLHGLIKLLPVVLPIGVLYGGAAEACAGQPSGQILRRGQPAAAVCVVGEIKGHPAQALFLLQEALVHIVPILVVIFQEILEIRLVVNDQAGDAQLLQPGAQAVQLRRPGVDMYLDPVHRWVPTKKMPMVLGPVWLPITGPM